MRYEGERRVPGRFKKQLFNFEGTGKNNDLVFSNAGIRSKQIKKHCVLKPEASDIIESAMLKLGLSARAYTRVLKVDRTIADLAGSEHISAEHISESIQLRSVRQGCFPSYSS